MFPNVQPPSASRLVIVLPWLAAACAGDTAPECKEGYARDSKGRCQLVEDDSSDGPNTPPTAPAVAIAPEAPRALGMPLVCDVYSESVDTDGDAISYTMAWTMNGSEFSGPSTTHWAGDTIPSASLTEGDEWTCTATPNDGREDGPTGSDTVRVDGGFKGWDEQTLSLGDADYIITGEETGRSMGSAISSAGDIDQDGKTDFLVGDYWWEHPEMGLNAGKVYLFLGADLGAGQSISAADAAYAFEGEYGQREDDPDCDPDFPDERCGGDWVGHSVGGGMDGDGDGVADLLLCAYRSDDGGHDRGKPAFFSGGQLGQRGVKSVADADVFIFGEVEGDALGHSVNWGGDVDGDGIADFVTGSHIHSPSVGMSAGRTYLILSGKMNAGEDLHLPGDADYIWDGEDPEDEGGKRNVYAGDIDGDGMADIATVALKNQDNGVGDDVTGERRGSGKFYIIMSSDINATPPGSVMNVGDIAMAWMGEYGGDALGDGVDSMGDFDGDGLDDISAGSFGNSENGIYAGKSYVITAADMPTQAVRSVAEASYNFIGEADNDWSGMAVGPAGDMDRDGLTDLVIGSMGHSRPGTEQVGRSYLFYAKNVEPGSHSVAEADHIFDGVSAWEQSGYRIAGPGDVNGDGMPDLLIGAWQGDSPGQPGKLYVMLNP